MAQSKLAFRYRHIAAVVEVTEDLNEVILFSGYGSRGSPISETTIVRLEKKRPGSATSATVENWKITDVAGPSQLGSRERKQYKKDLYEKENEKAYNRAVKEQLSVPIYIGRLNFVGLPRSGKTTTMKRLIGEILNIMNAKHGKEEKSTGVAERNQVIIKCVTESIGFASRRKWSRKNLTGQIAVFNQLILQKVKGTTSVYTEPEKLPSQAEISVNVSVPSEEVEITPYTSDSEDEVSTSRNQDFTNRLLPQDVHVHGNFDSLLSSYLEEDSDTVRYKLEDTIYLINTDTGGQTEFLDLMSRFLMGPALNLIVSRLQDPLDQLYEIYVTDENGVRSKKEDSIITLEEVIFQALASIASLKTSYTDGAFPMEENSDIKLPHCSSKAIFVGTFRDKVTQEQFKEKDELLQKKIMETDFYRENLVIFASEHQLIYPLDNLKGDQDEIDKFRSSIEKVIKDKFQQVEAPVSWLMLNVNIRHEGKHIMTLSECEEMAAKLGISKENLPTALWFLHHRVGILLYYPEIPGFADLIICEIQVIFDTATHLVKKTFIFEKVGKRAAETFKEKAQFTLDDLHQAMSKTVGYDLIPMEKLVILLEHHKILAALPQHEGQPVTKTYFMPCVLRSARPIELQNVLTSPHVAPLIIRYKCGYVPLGVFSSLIIALVSNDNNWILIEDKPKRNKIEFRVGDDCDTVTLISQPTFLKVVLFREGNPKNCTSSVCSAVRDAIKSALERVHEDLKYHSTAKFQCGFECPVHRKKDHLCVSDDSNTLLCLQNQKRPDVIRMTSRKHRVWFHKVEDEPRQIWEELTLHPVYSILMILLLFGFGALMLSIVSGIITFNNTKNPAATLELSLDGTPLLSDFLSFPRYSDSEKKNIVEVVARDCEDLGHHLGLEMFEVENIKADSVHRTVVDKCREIIKKWLQKSKPKFPITWRTFLKGLEDINYWVLRDFMHKILTKSYSDEGKEL